MKGRLVSLSAPVFRISDLDSDSIKLQSHSNKEVDEEIDFSEFVKKYRLTLKQKIKFKQTHVMRIVEDFSDTKADPSNIEGITAEGNIQFFELQVTSDTDNNIIMLS